MGTILVTRTGEIEELKAGVPPEFDVDIADRFGAIQMLIRCGESICLQIGFSGEPSDHSTYKDLTRHGDIMPDGLGPNTRFALVTSVDTRLRDSANLLISKWVTEGLLQFLCNDHDDIKLLSSMSKFF